MIFFGLWVLDVCVELLNYIKPYLMCSFLHSEKNMSSISTIPLRYRVIMRSKRPESFYKLNCFCFVFENWLKTIENSIRILLWFAMKLIKAIVLICEAFVRSLEGQVHKKSRLKNLFSLIFTS